MRVEEKIPLTVGGQAVLEGVMMRNAVSSKVSLKLSVLFSLIQFHKGSYLLIAYLTCKLFSRILPLYLYSAALISSIQ